MVGLTENISNVESFSKKKKKIVCGEGKHNRTLFSFIWLIGTKVREMHGWEEREKGKEHGGTRTSLQ